MKNFAYLFFFLLSFAFVISINTSCNKEAQTITKTVVRTDTIFINNTDTVIVNTTDTVIVNTIDTIIVMKTDTLILSDTVNLTKFIHDTATTFIVVRHADIDHDGSSDPELNDAGMRRANTLKRALKDIPLKAVYSTDYKRTSNTVKPTADEHGLNIEIYQAFSLSALTNKILKEHWSESVLVVGHGNTTPSFLNVLLGSKKYSDFEEDEFDNLFIVTVFEKGRAKVVHLKYGE